MLTKELFGKFANYLQVGPKLRQETALSYMSAIKIYVTVELNSAIFQSVSGQWYKNLRSKMEKEYVNQSIQTGEEIQTRAEAMSVVELAEICQAIFRLKNYKDRALLCIQYHCFGRISEVVAVNFSCLKWNSSLCCLTVDWNRIKVQRQGSFNVFPDAMT
jgi:site-specific recombinase XerC